MLPLRIPLMPALLVCTESNKASFPSVIFILHASVTHAVRIGNANTLGSKGKEFVDLTFPAILRCYNCDVLFPAGSLLTDFSEMFKFPGDAQTSFQLCDSLYCKLKGGKKISQPLVLFFETGYFCLILFHQHGQHGYLIEHTVPSKHAQIRYRG